MLLRILKSSVSIFFILTGFLLNAQPRLLKQEAFQHLDLEKEWIIVKYKSSALKAPNSTPLHIVSAPGSPSVLDGMVKIQIGPHDNPLDVCNQLLKDPNVQYAEPIVKNYLLTTPTDPLTASQYYLENIRALEAWEVTKGDDDIAIGIIDTGADLDHEDLIANVWVNVNDPIDGLDNDGNGYVDDFYGYDFSDDDSDPEAGEDSHGTLVAGIAGATTNNSLGIAGIGYNTKIAILKGFSSINGTGIGLFDAILYAADNGIEVLNLSWGSIREPLQSEQDIINYAVIEKDVVVVAAAGNDGNLPSREEKFYPASYDNVLSVAGSTAEDTKWSGSSYNHGVDLIAPAAGIFSTSLNNGYGPSGFGTSFGSPMVAATAALVKAQFPNLTAQQVMERVRITTDNIYDLPANLDFEGKLGSGRLNVFRAVSESNLKSLRAENIVISKGTEDPIFFGDTLEISLALTNYLEPVVDPTIYLSSPENEFYLETNSFFPGSMATFEEENITFNIILNEELFPETNVDVRLDFQDGTYSDYQFIDITTAPDYADFGNSNLMLPIAGDGRLGTIDFTTSEGPGLLFESEQVASHLGIMIGTGADHLSDNILNDFDTLTRDNDFSTNQYFKIEHHPFADRYGNSSFLDSRNNLLVEQANITSADGSFLINRYRLVNQGTDTLRDLSFGLFVDWELQEDSTNYAAFDEVENILFARNKDSTSFAGTLVMGIGTVNFSAIDLGEQNGNSSDIENKFTDQNKYELLIQNKSEAGANGLGNDVAALHGITISQLNPNDFRYVNVLLGVGASQSELYGRLQDAANYLDEFTKNPQVLQTVFSCVSGEVQLDPDGDLFIFYEDALGLLPLDTASTFSPAMIDRDTSFFVQNLDAGYPSEVGEIRVRLLEDIADFELGTDTLYLDPLTTRVVNFTDRSLGAISWSWDFGEGTQSVLQNPSILFNQEGAYSISLTVENQFGCIDSTTKTLVVAARPEDLIFNPVVLCPNESSILSNTLATKLFLYSSASQLTPIQSGTSLEIGPFQSDTVLYAAGLVNGFLTNRTEVAIDVLEVAADILILPDTLESEFQLRAQALIEENSSIEWLVNGQSFEGTNEVVIPATPGSQQFQLQILGSNGCEITKQRQFEVSSSPTPLITDLKGCAETPVVLRPQNGSYFGFYEDIDLMNLISKGTQLTVTETTRIFVVSIDDGLPGNPAEVQVTFESFDPKIEFEVSRVGDKNKVALSVNSLVPVHSFEWLIDGERLGSSPSPTFFLDDVVTKISLNATSALGCTSADTLTLDLTLEVIPLGVTETDPSIFPNPTTGVVNILGDYIIDEISVSNLTGKKLINYDPTSRSIDLSALNRGIYLLEIRSGNTFKKQKVIIQ